MSLCNSIAGLYFEGTCGVISVTMVMHKVHKNVHSILVFVNYLFRARNKCISQILFYPVSAKGTNNLVVFQCIVFQCIVGNDAII